MKKLLFFSLFLCLGMVSCLKDECTSTTTMAIYDPVIMHASEFRTSDIVVSTQKPLENPGKLYFYKNFLLINEFGEGIHFYNIQNPNQPDQVAFYHIPGNFDMAIKDDILYADQAVDLISIDLSDIGSPRLIQRVENYKNEYVPQDEMYYIYSIRTNQTRVLDCGNPNVGRPFFVNNNVGFVDVLFNAPAVRFSNDGLVAEAAGAGGSGGNFGIGGSFARFTIANDHLFTVSQSDLMSWNVDHGNIESIAVRNMGWGIETVYPLNDYLFIGSNTGMFVYDIQDPAFPVRLSSFTHAAACDPVVSDGNYAYVTLRDGTQCQGFVNQMDIIDVSDIRTPYLVKTESMINPHGLSITEDLLIVGEGDYGIKLFSRSNPDNPELLEYREDIKTYDVIALSKDLLFVVGNDGFYTAQIKNNKIEIIGSILVEKG